MNTTTTYAKCVVIDGRRIATHRLAKRILKSDYYMDEHPEDLPDLAWRAYLDIEAADEFNGKGEVGNLRFDTEAMDGSYINYEMRVDGPAARGSRMWPIVNVWVCLDHDEIRTATDAVQQWLADPRNACAH